MERFSLFGLPAAGGSLSFRYTWGVLSAWRHLRLIYLGTGRGEISPVNRSHNNSLPGGSSGPSVGLVPGAIFTFIGVTDRFFSP